MNNSPFSWIFAITAFFMLGIVASTPGYGQEINASVTVDRSQLSSTSLGYLDNLDDKIEVYINEYDWINHTFSEVEQIGMDIQITLMGVDEDFNFDAQIIIRSRRPIYNTVQETPLFLFNDEDWTFNYRPNRTFIHDELQFDRLTSLLDFYAYVVLGYDYDSFEQLGGTPYYSQAQNIVSRAQSTTSQGWSRTGSNSRNRAHLIADLMNASYENFRLAIYQYHRKGLDIFVDNPQKGRQIVIEALRKIQEAKRTNSGNLLFDTFFNAKYREIVSIFEDADPRVRLEAYNLLSDIDQSHMSAYQKLQQ